LAERTPHAGVDRDPGGRIWAWHRSNGATRCTVVQLCGAGISRMRTRVLWALRVELHQSVDDDRGEMYLAKLAEVEASRRDFEEDNVGRM
jgi:hypothetical protein